MTGKQEATRNGRPLTGWRPDIVREHCPEVLGLYLERPCNQGAGAWQCLEGRFGYSDLKGAAPTVGSLCTLNRSEDGLEVGGVTVTGWADRRQWEMGSANLVFLRQIDTDEMSWIVVGARRDTMTPCMPQRVDRSRMQMWFHAAHNAGWGGERSRSS
jgi:hypothetical protein